MSQNGLPIAQFEAISADLVGQALVSRSGFSGRSTALPRLMHRALASCQRNRLRAGFEPIVRDDGRELYMIDIHNLWTPQIVKDAITRLSLVQTVAISNTVGAPLTFKQAGFNYLEPGVQPPLHSDKGFVLSVVCSEGASRYFSVDYSRHSQASLDEYDQLDVPDTGMVATTGTEIAALELDPVPAVSAHTASETSGRASRRSIVMSYGLADVA